MKLGPNISAVVAGGAVGFGAAAAEALAAAGCKVAILDMYRQPGEALADKIGGIYCHLEISSKITVDTALDFARETNGVERILINFAGISETQPTAWRDPHTGRILIHDIPSFERLLQVNLTGTFYMATKAAQAMMTLPPLGPGGERGVIINSASTSSEDGQAGQVAYAASEGGVLALTRPMARDLLNEGIRVMTIMPGMYDTEMFAQRSEDARQMVGAAKMRVSGMTDPAEVAGAVLKICEDEQMNGLVLRLENRRVSG